MDSQAAPTHPIHRNNNPHVRSAALRMRDQIGLEMVPPDSPYASSIPLSEPLYLAMPKIHLEFSPQDPCWLNDTLPPLELDAEPSPEPWLRPDPTADEMAWLNVDDKSWLRSDLTANEMAWLGGAALGTHQQGEFPQTCRRRRDGVYFNQHDLHAGRA